jgi:hypothetical protein
MTLFDKKRGAGRGGGSKEWKGEVVEERGGVCKSGRRGWEGERVYIKKKK